MGLSGDPRLGGWPHQGETINLAYGQGNTLGRMAELVASALGKESRITTAPVLMGEVTRYVANITQARKLLGYEPKVSLDEGIRRSVEWSRDWAAAHGTTLARPYIATREGATAEGIEFKAQASSVAD